MNRFVVLLRGVNVGGHNRLPMADLREALTTSGLAGVRTYIQSGNIVADAPARDPEAVAARVRSVIARAFTLDVPAIALTADGWRTLVDANPYPDEADPRRVHAIALPYEPTEAARQAITRRTAAATTGRDSLTLVGRTAYLHTPDGFGTSALATALLSGRSSPLSDGTARNWATVTALLGLVAEP